MRKRKNSDEYVRGLERKVLGGDLTVVPELARAYERLGRGERLTEVQVTFEDGSVAPVVVPTGHPFAQARFWSAIASQDVEVHDEDAQRVPPPGCDRFCLEHSPECVRAGGRHHGRRCSHFALMHVNSCVRIPRRREIWQERGGYDPIPASEATGYCDYCDRFCRPRDYHSRCDEGTHCPFNHGALDENWTGRIGP